MLRDDDAVVGTRQLELVSPIPDFHAGTALEKSQMLVELAAQVGQALIVGRLEGNFDCYDAHLCRFVTKRENITAQ